MLNKSVGSGSWIRARERLARRVLSRCVWAVCMPVLGGCSAAHGTLPDAGGAAGSSTGMLLVVEPWGTTVDAGGGASCALARGDELLCWGASYAARIRNATDPPPGRYRAVSVGGDHGCVLQFDGALRCWGDDSSGQRARSDYAYAGVSTSENATCGVRTDGTLDCWGTLSTYGAVAPPGRYRFVALGAVHACGIRADRSTICWGLSIHRQTKAPAGRFVELALGWQFSCGLTAEGQLACWGNPPAGIEEMQGPFRHLAAAHASLCALDEGGFVRCSGLPPHTAKPAPKRVKFKELGAGEKHFCGRTDAGEILCWGDGWEAMDVPSGL